MKRVFLVILVTLLLAAVGGGAASDQGRCVGVRRRPLSGSFRPTVGRRSWVGCGGGSGDQPERWDARLSGRRAAPG